MKIKTVKDLSDQLIKLITKYPDRANCKLMFEARDEDYTTLPVHQFHFRFGELSKYNQVRLSPNASTHAELQLRAFFKDKKYGWVNVDNQYLLKQSKENE